MSEPDAAKTALDDLIAGIDDQEMPSILPLLLKHSATFYRYSPRNQMLLALQAHQRGFVPRLVGGFNTWKTYGRYAAKGSKGLQIFAPIRGAKLITAEVDGVEKEFRSAKAVPKGARVTGETVGRVRFKLTTVFDVSQTAGDPMPELTGLIAPESSDNAFLLLGHLTRFVESRGWKVNFSDVQQGLSGGYANHELKEITVGNWEPVEAQLATLAHETGHMFLHGSDDKLGGNYHVSKAARGYAELEAEGVAVAFLAAHGIDHSKGTAAYMAGWADAARQVELVNIAESGDPTTTITRQDALLTVSQRILTTTNQMLEAIKPIGAGGRLDRNPKIEVEDPIVHNEIEIVPAQVQDIDTKGMNR